MLDDEGVLKIADFGFATSATHSYEIAGTQSYALPEMGHDCVNTTHADLWAVGVILFTMYAGHPPFTVP